MSERFLGVPLLFWGLACLVVAAIWVMVWPAEQAAGAAGLRFFLIRWGHAITWVLLALMCFLRAAGSPAALAWAQPVGPAALFVYLAFLASTFVLR